MEPDSWWVCGQLFQAFSCDPQQPVYNFIEGYSLSTLNVLTSITLQPRGNGFASQTVASAGDHYFLSSESTPQVEVDRTNGLIGTIRSFGPAFLLMSSDLTTALVVGASGQFGVYRAPFLAASDPGERIKACRSLIRAFTMPDTLGTTSSLSLRLAADIRSKSSTSRAANTWGTSTSPVPLIMPMPALASTDEL